MTTDRLLMIFVKNPEQGKVKTRLAQSIGDEKALKIYRTLLNKTATISSTVRSDKAVFYSEFVDDDDLWNNYFYQKYYQEGDGLGDRMKNAFSLAFEKGYNQVLIIGSDCYELTSAIIEQAFELLDEKEVAIGPASDGGYYLLGMHKLHKELFLNKKWSSENVLLDTLLDLKEKNISYGLLETLSDVDYEEDLASLKNLIDEE